MAVTDAMVEAGCKVLHGTRAWNKAVRDTDVPDMSAWVTSRRELMRQVLTAAIEASDRNDPAEVWEDYLREVPKEKDRSLQGALAFGYSAGRPF